MIDAYTIGIRLALTDDVSAGVARMQGGLTGLRRAARATEARIASMSDLARRGMDAAEAGARRLGRGGMAPRRTRSLAAPGSLPVSPPGRVVRIAGLAGTSAGRSGRHDRSAPAAARGPMREHRGIPIGGNHDSRQSGSGRHRTPSISHASKPGRLVRSGLFAALQPDRLVSKRIPAGLQPSPRAELRIASRLQLDGSVKQARLDAPGGRGPVRSGAPPRLDAGVREAATARADVAKPMSAGRPARRPAIASAVSTRVRPPPSVAANVPSRPNMVGPGTVSPVRAKWLSRSMAPGATVPRQRPPTTAAATVPAAADSAPPNVPMEARAIG